RAVDAGEILDLAAPRPRIEALWIARLADLEWGIHVDLGKTDIAGDLSRDTALVAEGRDERDDDDEARVGHELGHFRHATDVLHARFLGETEILVESVADIVAIEDVGMPPLGSEALFEQVGD